MNDNEFLDYCEAHASTPRAGFVPEQLHRLFVLAGDPAGGNWDKVPKGHIESFGSCPWHITERVTKARILNSEAHGDASGHAKAQQGHSARGGCADEAVSPSGDKPAPLPQ